MESRERVEGSVLFERWINSAFGGVQARAAEHLGEAASAVFGWVEGSQRPGAAKREKIEVRTGGAVPRPSWLTKKERAEIDAPVPAIPARTGTDS